MGQVGNFTKIAWTQFLKFGCLGTTQETLCCLIIYNLK